MNKKYTILKNEAISKDELDLLGKNFRAFNESIVGKHEYKSVNIVIVNEKSEIIAGSIGGIIWGWLSVEQFWVKSEYRNRGIGTYLLRAIEREAVKNNISNISHRAFTEPWTNFYLDRGYIIDGTLENRPPGYKFNFISRNLQSKVVIPDLPEGFEMILNDYSEQKLTAQLNQQIYKEFDEVLGDIPFKMIKIVFKDSDSLIAGISGYIGWGWLYISVLWVDPENRGQNLAKDLMQLVEKEAIDFGVTRAFIGTTDFQAPGFYSKLGYETFSIRENLPPGHRNYSMKKNLVR